MLTEASHPINADVPPDEHRGEFEASTPQNKEIAEPTPYHILRSPEEREQYLHLTDNLIREMVEQETDVAIFLDKSARPVAWMVHALWDQLAPRHPDGTVYPEPAIKFLNIDREQWTAITGNDETGRMNVDEIPADRIEELQKVMTPINEIASEDGPAPAKSLLSGKNIMVVDEISVSRQTLNLSERIIKRAFPDASVVAAPWMEGQPTRNSESGQMISKNNPVWYSDKKTTGRGVANRDTTRAAQLHSARSRIGKYWLSVPFREPDTEGIQLRRETRQMARDLQEHRILYRPSSWRPEIESIDERIERINGISPDQYKNLRAEARGPYDLIEKLGEMAHQRAQDE